MGEYETKRKKILDAAKKQFSVFGYQKTTLADIGKLVNLNKSSLLYYYKNKDDLFLELLIKESDDLLNKAYSGIDKDADYKKTILDYLKNKLEFCQSIINLHQISEEAKKYMKETSVEKLININNNEIEFIKGILNNALKNNEIKPCDTKRIATDVLYVFNTMKKSTCNRELHELNKEIIFVISIFLDGLK